MCGRYEFDVTINSQEMKDIVQAIHKEYPNTEISYQTGEIYPTNLVPVLLLQNGRPIIRIMHWGFPKWDGKGHLINARSETIQEKRLFAESYQKRRCVVLGTGFYEWQRIGESKEKDKYRFKSDGSLLYKAGLFDTYPIKGEPTECFVILTQSANATMADVHDRMPVLLHKSELIAWLVDNQAADALCKRQDFILNREKMNNDREVFV